MWRDKGRRRRSPAGDGSGVVSDIGGTVARGMAWALVTLLSLLLGGVVAFGPIMLLPGPVHTDLVNGHWVKVAGLSFALAILLWRMAPLREERRFSLAVGATFIRVTVFALRWPSGRWVCSHGSTAMARTKRAAMTCW
jgi:hypothetical protein